MWEDVQETSGAVQSDCGVVDQTKSQPGKDSGAGESRDYTIFIKAHFGMWEKLTA